MVRVLNILRGILPLGSIPTLTAYECTRGRFPPPSGARAPSRKDSLRFPQGLKFRTSKLLTLQSVRLIYKSRGIFPANE